MYPMIVLFGYIGFLFLSNRDLQQGVSSRFKINEQTLYITILVLTVILWIYYFIFHGSTTQEAICEETVPANPNNTRSTSGIEGFQNHFMKSNTNSIEEPFVTDVTIEMLTRDRKFSDFSMLTVAYPTLDANTTPPNPNTNETFGSHSIANLQNTLNQGIFSVYEDIYYNESSNPPGWFIGTINEDTGTVQNISTIRLISFLEKMKEHQLMMTSKKKYTVIFLNPQYTRQQLSKRTSLENELGSLLNRYQTSTSSNMIGSIQKESIADVNISQVVGKIVYILGGSVPSSETLVKAIHGVADFTTLRLNPGKPAIRKSTEVPLNSIPSRVSVFNAGDTSLGNFKRNATSSSTGIVNSQLLMIFPASTSSNVPYSPDEMPHIVNGSHFTVVYPGHLLNPSKFNDSKNRILWNGYGNSTMIKDGYIQSVLITVDKSVIDADDKLCNTPEPKHLNPRNDTTWDSILGSSGVTRSNYCEKSKNGINENVYDGLRFYKGFQGSGIIPRPSVVQYCLGVGGCSLYYLRDKKQISEQTVTSA
jgi:hypothetical protein